MFRILRIILLAIAAMFSASTPTARATTKNPMPFIKIQYFTSTGDPCAGCKLYTYQAGTSTPLATYTDSAAGGTNANPIILDSAGRADVFLSTVSYKFVLKTAADVIIWTEDNISGGIAPTDALGFAPSQGSGLTLNVAAGKAMCADGSVFTYAGGTVLVNDNATTYIGINYSCVVGTGSAYGYSGAGAPIARITAAGGVITSITDDRSNYQYPTKLMPYSLKGSILAGTGTSGLVSAIPAGSDGDCLKYRSANPNGIATGACTDIGFAPSAVSGLTLNIGPGVGFCNDGTELLISGSGVNYTMTNNATNYVQFAAIADGCNTAVITHNTTGYTGIPIARVVTSGGAIVSVTDVRSSFVSPGVALQIPGAGTLVTSDGNELSYVGVGSDFQCLQANSGSSAGLAWADCPSGARGISRTIVVKGSDGNDCNVVYSLGVMTSTTCP